MTAISSINVDIDLTNLYQSFTPTDVITFLQYGNHPEKGINQKQPRKARKPKPKKSFYNQITMHVDCEKNVNVKLFNNGRIQMTGLKYETHGKKVVETVLRELQALDAKSSHRCLISTDWFISPTDIACINSDFSVGFPIKRDMLHREIVNHGFYSSYEPCIYPGVNIKYYYNEDCVGGICQCNSPCTGKGCGKGDGNCKKVTIAVFKSGKAIITGARSQTQLTTAYDFISKFIQQRFQTIKLN